MKHLHFAWFHSGFSLHIDIGTDLLVSLYRVQRELFDRSAAQVYVYNESNRLCCCDEPQTKIYTIRLNFICARRSSMLYIYNRVYNLLCSTVISRSFSRTVVFLHFPFLFSISETRAAWNMKTFDAGYLRRVDFPFRGYCTYTYIYRNIVSMVRVIMAFACFFDFAAAWEKRIR